MNQIYIKSLIHSFLFFTLTVIWVPANAQKTKHEKHGDRAELIANVQKVQLDLRKIASLKANIKESKEANNKKALKVHRHKLELEKQLLKEDYAKAKQDESVYVENKNKKIQGLKTELKATTEKYEGLRKKIRKDLSKRNDFALQKNAAELLKTVQFRNETSTELAMEKSDLYATCEALETEWKKVKNFAQEPELNRRVIRGNNLSTAN